jgi:hypothetical protein
MPSHWVCTEGHGRFLQTALDELQRDHAWTRRSVPGLRSDGRDSPPRKPMDRYNCPVCAAAGKPGWVRPATASDAAERATLPLMSVRS